jgi:hypothetical protein
MPSFDPASDREENFSGFMLLSHPDQMLIQGHGPLFARFHGRLSTNTMITSQQFSGFGFRFRAERETRNVRLYDAGI